MEMDKMEDAKYLDMMAKYLSGNLKGPEREALFAWIEQSEANRKFFDEMIQLWSISNDYEDESFEADVEKAWQHLDDRLSNRKHPASSEGSAPSDKIIPLSNYHRWWRYAAVILLTLVLGVWLWMDPYDWRLTTVATAGGSEVKEYTFPDGSTVWLNERTTLAYRWPFWTRDVHLEGEAFFDVQKAAERPFTILSGEARTTVLGTTFNVRAYADEAVVEVTVRSGVVRLEDRSQRGREILLEAGNSGIFDEKSQEVRVLDGMSSNADAWKTRRLEFEETPLEEVIPVLERYYGVKIEVANEAILKCPLNFKGTNPRLSNLMETIEFSLNDVETERRNDSLYLFRGQGCQ
jgi:transmembrane sensor